MMKRAGNFTSSATSTSTSTLATSAAVNTGRLDARSYADSLAVNQMKGIIVAQELNRPIFQNLPAQSVQRILFWGAPH